MTQVTPSCGAVENNFNFELIKISCPDGLHAPYWTLTYAVCTISKILHTVNLILAFKYTLIL